MLREMTRSALAHSFKRFAQCAVVGLALAGLAACGGGNGLGGVVTQKPLYTSLVLNVSSARASMNPGDTLAEARNNALTACGDGCVEYAWVRNGCVALARNRAGNFWGAGWASSEDVAERDAIVICNFASVEGGEGQTCSIPTGTRNVPFSVCNKRGSLSATGDAKLIPRRQSAPRQDSEPPVRTGGETRVQACFADQAAGASCAENRSTAADEDCSQYGSSYRSVSQCPRSSSEYRGIGECRMESSNTSLFWYTILGDVSSFRSACTGTWIVHQ